MSDLSEKIQEVAESAPESRLNTRVALMVSLAATFMALCNVKDGNVVQAMQQAQTEAVNQWNYYQAKSTKQHLAENTREMLTLQLETTPGLTPEAKAVITKKVEHYDSLVKKYEGEKEAIKKKAEKLQEDYEEINVHDDQFDMAEACLSVGIAPRRCCFLGETELALHRGVRVFGIRPDPGSFRLSQLEPPPGMAGKASHLE